MGHDEQVLNDKSQLEIFLQPTPTIDFENENDFAKYYPHFDEPGKTADFDQEVILETST